MEFKKTDIIDAAGRIILQSGINALTIEELALKMGAPYDEFSMYFKKDSNILVMLLINFEGEIKTIITDVTNRKLSPEEELQCLFKKLYKLFGQKPYYLPIILSTEVTENNADLHNILERIKTAVEMHLLQVINKGKHKKLFVTETRTRLLVNRILGSFRLLMNEQRVTTDLIRKIDQLKSRRNSD